MITKTKTKLRTELTEFRMLLRAIPAATVSLFVVSVILIAGIGGLTLNFGSVTITSIACALILGILTNVMLSRKKD